MARRVYGLDWSTAYDDLRIELAMIRSGGHITAGGVTGGEGLFHHYRQAMRIIWPDDDHHRWSDLMLKEWLENRITIVQGAKDTSKTYSWSRIALADYWAFPDETLWLVSSTGLRELQLRVWGNIKDLFNRARERFPYLSGHVLESMHAILTEESSDDEVARDIRKGIICIPCISGSGEWTGIQKFIGIKQKRRRLLADELQFMRPPYLISLEHLDKGDFKLAGSGNPIGQGDPLDKLAEPIGGWGTEPDSTKTEVWKNKWGGVTIQLDSRDSPNTDEPAGRFPYMINAGDIERTARRYGTDSATYWNQVIGRRKAGLDAHRVLTDKMCVHYGAYKPCVWEGGNILKVYALDSAFGGDRAVGGPIEFGPEVGGRMVIKCGTPEILPVRITKNETPEEQLTAQVKNRMSFHQIPPEHLFFDAGMYATLATKLSAEIGTAVNAVNFQGSATSRPVSNDEWIFDQVQRQNRLKRCDEHYSKFVTELWFSVRLVVECGQMREIPKDVVGEFAMREWYKVSGDRFEIESKEDMKLRIGFSPDLADWLAIAVEGARRLGFLIERLKNIQDTQDHDDWLEREYEKHRRSFKRYELKRV